MNTIKDKHSFKPLLIEIEDRPLNPVGRILFYLLLIIVVVSILWLYLSKIDIVVSADSKIVPSGEIKTYQALDKGFLEKIFVQEGELIEENYPLLKINNDINKVNLINKEEQLKVEEIELNKVLFLLNEPYSLDNTNLDLAKEEKSIYLNAIEKLNIKKGTIEQDIKILKEKKDYLDKEKNYLSNKEQLLKNIINIIAKKDYIEIENLLNKNKSDLTITNMELEKNKLSLKDLNSEKEITEKDYFNKNIIKKIEKTKTINNLKSEIDSLNINNKQQIIESKEKGTIVKIFKQTERSVVSPGEDLISILPENSELIAKAKILSSEIGLIEKGMKTKVKINTFPFQKYGLLNGEIINVSKDAIKDEKLGWIYEVKIKLEKNYLKVENKEFYLQSGMECVSEIVIGDRRIINFFLYPIINYLDSGLSVN